MVQGSTLQGRSLTQWAAPAFLVAVVARVGNEVIAHLGQAMGVAAPKMLGDLTIVVVYSGALVGLLGIYHYVVEQTPRLASAGLLAVGITGVSIVASIIGKYVVGGPEPQGVLLVIPVSFYIFSTMGFFLFGIASLRTSAPSRTVGYLLLVVGASRVITVAGLLELGSVLFVLPLLGIGYLLWGTASQPMIEVSADETNT